MAQVKKISVATVYGVIERKKVIDSAGKPIPIMRVIGQAVGTKSGTSNFGDWVCLVGQFKATNLETGETMEAAQCFLPDVALIPLQVGLSAEGARGVQFAIDVFASLSNNTKPGGSLYEYSFENVLPPADTDPIRALELRIAEMSQLPAPAADAVPASIAAEATPAADVGPAADPAPAAEAKSRRK